MSKPRLLFAMPGLNSGAFSAYSVTAEHLVRALSRTFDIGFLYRSILAPPSHSFPYASILREQDVPEWIKGSARSFFTGADIAAQYAYRRRAAAFASRLADRWDFLLEKQWSHVGTLARSAHQAGLGAGFVYEGEFYDGAPLTGPVSPRARISRAIQRLWRDNARRAGLATADLVICETEQAATTARALHPAVRDEQLAVIGIGVDTAVLRPRPREAARVRLGIPADRLVVAYVGALNGSIQDPGEVIAGLALARQPAITLHVVGQGDRADRLARDAQAAGLDAVFHGRLPQADAAEVIAAADLCLAPYRASSYRDGIMTSASCKVSEYLACGRPVLAPPEARVRHLLAEGRYGFLVPDEATAYAAFFSSDDLPARLRAKEAATIEDLNRGHLRRAGIVPTWSDIADAYRDAILGALTRRHAGHPVADAAAAVKAAVAR